MHYLMKCDADNSYCTVEDYQVIHDPDVPPTVNDSVSFYWGNDKYMGTILKTSDDVDELKELAKKWSMKRQTRADTKNSSPLPPKRSRKPEKSWSFSEQDKDSPVKKDEKVLNNKADTKQSKNLKQQIKTLIYKDTGALEEANKSTSASKPDPKTSPSKEELKLLIEQQQKLLASIQGTPSSTSTKDASSSKRVLEKYFPSDDDDDSDKDDDETREQKDRNDESPEGEEDFDKNSRDPQNHDAKSAELDNSELTGALKTETGENVNPQLYGRNSSEPMVLLKYNIYCKKTAFDDAVDYSRKSATSFLRRLMNGVFKRSAILDCTYSGRPPNAQGVARKSEKVQSLDRTAKKAVIEFCSEYASKKGWSVSSDAELRKAMTQWIGEVKREIKKNLNKSA